MKLTGKTILSLGAAILVSAPAIGSEKKIQRSELPTDVQKAADVEAQGATIVGYSKEIEHGNTYYEVETVASGRHKDILIDSTGTVVEIEQEVGMESLSPEVRFGLETKAGGGTVKKVESLTKHGNLVAYEAQVVTKGKKSEIQVGPDGKSLPHEE